MEDIIAAIEEKAKYMQDSEGDKHYRKGYVHALRAVSKFLIGQSETRDHESDTATVERLFAFAALQRSLRLGYPSNAVEIAANVLPSAHETCEFFKAYVHTHGTQALSPAGQSFMHILRSRPASTSEAGFDLLQCYHDVLTIRKDRNPPQHTNTPKSSTAGQNPRQKGALAR